MNKAFLSGNLSKDVDIRTTNNGKSVATFSLAVKRNYKNDKGEYDTDFFTVIVYGSNAENCAKYLKKGSKVLTTGRIQNREYTAKDGTKRYVTEIVAEDVEFLGQPSTNKTKPEQQKEELVEIDDSDLPF